MRFGIFGTAQAESAERPGAPGQGFHDFIDLNVEAEALGYESCFLVEHHFTGWNQVSSTLTLLTWLAARTTRLRLGTAVMVLPWHNPVLLAEQAATLDLLSGGRLDFGVGKGYRHSEFTGFSVPLDESEARFAEALDLIIKAWSSTERFSHRGRFWQFEDIVVEPATAQRPHPPIWMAAGSPASIQKVAERGCNLLLDQFASIELTGERIAAFRRAVEARGRAFDAVKIAVARDMFVARTAAEKEAAIVRNAKGHERILAVARWPNRGGGSHILAYAHSPEQALTSPLIGTAEEVAAKLEALRDVGVDYVNPLGSRENLRRFGREIMPAFADSRAASLLVR
jgi:alkanesulfonate monooxygenase SsuD/methylene tetrahydromethanopterin reductase-like flavin-dependent oxidoreductase (luciferase family)